MTKLSEKLTPLLLYPNPLGLDWHEIISSLQALETENELYKKALELACDAMAEHSCSQMDNHYYISGNENKWLEEAKKKV